MTEDNENFSDAVAQQALDAGLMDDARPSEPPIQPEPHREPFKQWEPPTYNPWEDSSLLKVAADPYGIFVAREFHEEKHFSDQQLEVVRELWGKPEDHVYRIEDPSHALDVASFYRARGLINDDQLREFSEGLAHREILRNREEQTRLEEQERQEQERLNREQQETERREAIQQMATDAFYQKLDRLRTAEAAGN